VCGESRCACVWPDRFWSSAEAQLLCPPVQPRLASTALAHLPLQLHVVQQQVSCHQRQYCRCASKSPLQDGPRERKSSSRRCFLIGPFFGRNHRPEHHRRRGCSSAFPLQHGPPRFHLLPPVGGGQVKRLNPGQVLSSGLASHIGIHKVVFNGAQARRHFFIDDAQLVQPLGFFRGQGPQKIARQELIIVRTFIL